MANTFDFIGTAQNVNSQQATPTSSALGLLGSRQNRDAINAADRAETSLAENPLVSDLLNAPTAYLDLKYGPEVAQNRTQLLQENVDSQRYLNQDRSAGEFINDNARSALAGLANSVNSLTGVGIGLINGEEGVRFSEGTRRLTENILDGQSDAAKQKQYQAGLETSLLQEDNYREAVEEVENGGSAQMATLRRIGKDFLDSGRVTVNNGAALQNTVSQGLGSLLPSARLAGSAQAAIAARGGSKAAQTGGVALAVGAQEAAGSYGEVVQRVMEMSEETLTNGSKIYRDLRAEGASHEEAQRNVANQAGLRAVGTALPAAATLGAVSARFEAAPLKAGSIGEAALNVTSQTLEEAGQGAVSGLAGNQAIRTTVDEDQDIFEGVGQQIAEGAVGGLGMSGVLQGPALGARVAAPVVKTTAKASKNAAKLGIKGIQTAAPIVRAGTDAVSTLVQSKMDKIKEKRKNQGAQESTVGNATRDEEITAAQVQMENATDTLRQSAVPENVALADRYDGVLRMSQEEQDAVPESIREFSFGLEDDGTPTPPESRMDRLVHLTNSIISNQLDETQERDAALYIFEQLSQIQDFGEQDLDPEIADLDDQDPVKKAVVEAKENFQAIVFNVDFQKALMKAREVDLSQETPSTETPTTDEVRTNERLAVANPVGVNPDRINLIMDQRRRGTVSISDTSAKNLEAAAAISDGVNKAQEQKVKIEENKAKLQNETPAGRNSPRRGKTAEQVGREVRETGFSTKKGEQRSLKDYVSEVVAGVNSTTGRTLNRKNEIVSAQDSLDALRDFAQHFVNKVSALNQSVQQGGGVKVPYDALVDGQFHKGNGELTVHLKGAGAIGSKAFAQTVHADAQAVVDAYNTLLNTYGDSVGGTLIGRQMALPQLESAVYEGFDTAPIDVPDIFEGSTETSKDRYGEVDIEALEAEIDQQEAVEIEAAKADVAQRNLLKIPDDVLKQYLSANPFKGIPKIKKYPFTNLIKKTVGFIDPDGDVGQELRAADVTPSNTKGLFKKGGVKNLDNLPAEEFGDYQFLLPLADDGQYFDQQSVIDAIIMEHDGIPLSDFAQQEAESNREAVAEVISEAEDAGYTRESVKEENKKFRKKNEPVLEEISDQGELDLIGGKANETTKTTKLAENTQESSEGSKGTSETKSAQDTTPDDTQKVESGDAQGVTEDSTEAQPEGEAEVFPDLTDAELDTLNSYRAENVVSNLTQEAKQMIMDKVQPMLDKLGLDGLVKNLVFLESPDQAVQGFAFWKEGVIAVNEYSLDNIDTDPEVQHMLAHELFHLLDYIADSRNGNVNSAHHKANRYSRVDGDLHNELKALSESGPEWEKFLEYAFGFGSHIEVATELFAEAGALTLLNPEVATKEIPLNVQFINESLQKAGSSFQFELGSEQEVEESQSEGTGDVGSGDSTRDVTVPSDTDTELQPEQSVPETVESGTGTRLIVPETRLGRAFTVREVPSPLMEGGSGVMANMERLIQETKRLTGDQKNTLSKNLREFVPGITKALNDRLKSTPYSGKKGKSISEEILQNGDVSWIRRMKNTAAVDPKTGEYFPELINAASLAAAHFMHTARVNKVVDAEQVAKAFGVDVLSVTQDMMYAARVGISPLQAKETLGSLIQNFWGVRPNDDVSMSDTLGIPQGLASELLVTLVDKGFLTERRAPMIITNEDGSSQTVEFISLIPNYKWIEERNNELNGKLGIIEELVDPEADPEHFFDEAPKRVTRTQRRNPLGINSDQEREALNNVQNTPFRMNVPFTNFILSLGKERYGKLLGSKDINPERLNSFDLKSVEGKNLSNDSGYDNLLTKLAALQEHANLNETSPEEVDIFFKAYFSVVGRLHLDGWNPQSNKLARETMTTTNSVMDLTDPTEYNEFWLAIAQGSDEIKIERVDPDNIGNDIRQIVQEKYGNTIAVMKNWVAQNIGANLGQLDELTDAEFQTMLTELGESSDKILHSLLNVARFEYLSEFNPDGLREFENALSVESDGVTDGPIHAMIQFLTGEFDHDQLDNLDAGGVFLGEVGKTLNEYYTGGKLDLYERVAAILEERLANNLLHFQEDIRGPHMEALMRFMNTFADVSIDGDGSIVVGRKEVKNPLTVTIYGSGVRGITNKVVSGFMGSIYELMSDYASAKLDDPKKKITSLSKIENYPEFMADMDLLMNSRIFYSRKDDEWIVAKNRKSHVLPWSNPKEFTVSNEQLSTFVSNVQTLYTQEMDDSIQSVLGNVRDTTDLLLSTTQTQGVLTKVMFDRLVQEKLDERIAAGELRKGDKLSRNDYNSILLEVEKFTPVIENNSQSINMSVSERGKGPWELSSSMDERYRQNSTLPAPSPTGVRVIPFLTINRGDANMILRAFTGPDALQNAMTAFDGIELALHKMREQGKVINRAVAEAMMANAVRDAVTSWENFLRIDPFKNLKTMEEVRQVVDALFGPRSEEAENAGNSTDVDFWVNKIEERASNMLQSMEAFSRSIEARKLVFQDMGFTVDHMAGLQATHVHQPLSIEYKGADKVQIANKLYAEKLKRLENRKDAPKPVIEAPRDEFAAAIRTTGFEDESGSRVVSAKQVTSILRFARLTSDQATIYNTLKGKIPDDVIFVFGSSEQIAEYQKARGLYEEESEPVAEGQIDMRNGIIYISNESHETVLHEMLHGATIAKVLDYYDNPDVLSDDDKDAVRRLESLMGEFLDQGFQEDSLSAQAAVGDLKAAVEFHMADESNLGKAAALNEFMAWTLTNQNLIDIAKKQKVKSPLSRVVGKALTLMRRMFGFTKKDVYSNVLFNTKVILKTLSKTGKGNPALILNQVHGASNPENSVRIEELLRKWNQKITAFVGKPDAIDLLNGETSVQNYQVLAQDANLNGFPMTMQEHTAFVTLMSAMTSKMEYDGRQLLRVAEMYENFIDNVTVNDFLDDPESLDPESLNRAQDRYNFIVRRLGELSEGSRPLTMAGFLALSQTSEEFRKILSKMEPKKVVNLDFSSMDNALTSMAESILEALSRDLVSPSNRSTDVQQAMDRLSLALGRVENDVDFFLLRRSNDLVNKGDHVGSQIMSKLGTAIMDYSDKGIEAVPTQALKNIFQGTKAIGAVLDGNTAEGQAISLISLTNALNIWEPIRGVINEIIGQTDENKAVLQIVSKVKYAVSHARQSYREELPKVFDRQFKTKPTKEQYKHLHKGFGNTDLAALIPSMGTDAVIELLRNSTKFGNEINRTENDIHALAGSRAKDILAKTEQMANWMNGGNPGINLLKNAEAVARLLNEPKMEFEVDPDLIKAVDRLGSLYALRGLPGPVRTTLKNFAQNETDAMKFMAVTLQTLRNDEFKKAEQHPATFLNYHKGYIPSEIPEGVSLIVAEDGTSDTVNKEYMGYRRIGDYEGYRGVDGAKKGYYYAPINSKNTYSQGAMQTVQTTFFGIDPKSGKSMNGTTAGVITGPAVNNITRVVKSGRAQNEAEAMLPIFGPEGQVVAYERAMNPRMLEKLNRKEHLGLMTGAWAGRQVEEKISTEFNNLLVDKLHERWVQDSEAGRISLEYIDISSSDDPIHKDTWSVIPRTTKDYIREVFGEDVGFPVRKDLIDNSLGYRNASIRDLWTGESRSHKVLTDTVREAMVFLLGKKAYRTFVTGEKGIQEGVSLAKNIIVIRSGIVPALNISANIVQLMGKGVAGPDIYKGYRNKLLEIDALRKNEKRLIELKAQLNATEDNGTKRKIEAKIKAVEDSNNRMSIKPLVEAGLFGTIAEGISELDEALTSGGWMDWIEDHVDALPDGVKTIGKYAILSRDTALYKGMEKAVQYGDFLSKAVLYEDLVKKGMRSEEAIDYVREAFVDFNYLPSRTRNQLEQIGGTWFWAFKIRAIKEGLRMIRENPLRALATVGVGPEIAGPDFGSPILDNFVGTWMDDRIGYSVGWGMGMRAPSLHPTVNLLF